MPSVTGMCLRVLTGRKRPVASTAQQVGAEADTTTNESVELAEYPMVPGIPVLSEMTDQEIETMIEEALWEAEHGKTYTYEELMADLKRHRCERLARM